MVRLEMVKRLKRIPVKFYCTKSGVEPVRIWLKKLDKDDRRIIGEDIKDIEFSWPIGMPLCRSIDQGLWEVCSKIIHGRIARVIFYIAKAEMILLLGFVKKTQKIPDREKKLALKRKKEHQKYG